jgi:hypothetical protein
MAEPHVVAALKDKRADLSGTIADLEKQISQHRADLLHVDAVLRLFAPDLEPAAIRQGDASSERVVPAGRTGSDGARYPARRTGAAVDPCDHGPGDGAPRA